MADLKVKINIDLNFVFGQKACDIYVIDAKDRKYIFQDATLSQTGDMVIITMKDRTTVINWNCIKYISGKTTEDRL